jgi:hypothetical protein
MNSYSCREQPKAYLATRGSVVTFTSAVQSLEPAHTLGERARTAHLRFGVLNAGIAVAFGLGLVESGRFHRLGWLIALPLGLAAYGVLAGALGVCAMTGMRGERAADHGHETILDRGCARTIRGRAALLVFLSLGVAVLGAASFVSNLY